MTIVIDTNVVLSGVFFGGRPAAVLMACIEERATLALTRSRGCGLGFRALVSRRSTGEPA